MIINRNILTLALFIIVVVLPFTVIIVKKMDQKGLLLFGLIFLLSVWLIYSIFPE